MSQPLLKYLGKMAELDDAEIAMVYLSIQIMELVLIGARVGGGIMNTHELKVLNYKMAMQSLNADAWQKEIENEKA